MKNKDDTVYISCDIESNGPIPGDFSMLSLGAAAFTSDGTLLSTFSANLRTLPEASECPDTMKFWESNQEAYNATRQDTRDPKQAMEQFVSWVNKLDGKPVFVGYPATFDFMFVYHYMIHFGFKSPFSFSALDIKSYASAVLKTEYRQSTKKNMPKRWFSPAKHTHIAVEDAIEQGQLFCNMLKENLK
jgi:DNA polymerase III alpha subunit (gram-positive type)